LDEGSLLGRGQTLCEVVGKGLYWLDEFGVIGVECDALRERFNQNDGGGGTLRTKKYPTNPRMEKKLADSLKGKALSLQKEWGGL